MHKIISRNALKGAFEASKSIPCHEAGSIRFVLNMWSQRLPLAVTDTEAQRMRAMLDETGADHVRRMFDAALRGAAVLNR